MKRAREFVWLEGDPEKDHLTGLIVFGALEIVVGILAFSAAMFLLILTSAAGLGGMKASHFWMVMGLLFYLTGWFIVMGLGSIKAYRWARSLVLVGSWVTVFFGTLMLAMLLYILPGVYDLMAESGVLSASAAMAIIYCFAIMMLLFQLIMPMVAIAFYSLKGVQKTCERRNPEPCWTDCCPLPLMAMGFISVLGCLSVVAGSTTNYVVFLFGEIMTGLPGFGIVLAVSVACAYVGWGAFTQRMHAWWMAYALILLTSASMMLTFSEQEMSALYSAMNYSEDQILQLGRLHMLNPAVLTFITCIWGIMACIYLVWVRDCFQPKSEPVEVKSYRQRMAEEEATVIPEPLRPRMRLED